VALENKAVTKKVTAFFVVRIDDFRAVLGGCKAVV